MNWCGGNACPSHQPSSSGWDLGQDDKLQNGTNGTIGKLSHSNDVIGACICSNDVNVCSSAHCVCMVNSSVAMAAFEYLLLYTTISTLLMNCYIRIEANLHNIE